MGLQGYSAPTKYAVRRTSTSCRSHHRRRRPPGKVRTLTISPDGSPVRSNTLVLARRRPEAHAPTRPSAHSEEVSMLVGRTVMSRSAGRISAAVRRNRAGSLRIASPLLVQRLFGTCGPGPRLGGRSRWTGELSAMAGWVEGLLVGPRPQACATNQTRTTTPAPER
jgi:hypothetical protein